jgi:hypothetical protein
MNRPLFPILCLAASAVSGPALAEDDARPWTLSAGYSRLSAGGEAASGDADTVSVSLARRFGATTAAISGAASRRAVLFPDVVDRSDANSFAIGAALSHAIDATEIALLLDYAKESADVTIDPPSLPSFDAEAKNAFVSVAAAVSRTFGGATRLTPSASVGWSRSKAEIASAAGPFAAAQTSEGWTGTAGLFLAQDIGSRWTVSAGGAAIASEEAGALAVTSGGGRGRAQGGLFSGVQTLGQQGSLIFGELGAGLSTRLGRVTLSTDASHSVGLDDDYFILASSVSLDF